MAARPADAAHCAIRLRSAVAALSRQLWAASADVGLSVGKLMVMSQLYHGGPMAPTELAARGRVKLQSLTRLLAELQEQGLLERTPHESDARQSVLSLTREGLACLKTVVQSRERSLAAAIGRHLSAEETATLLQACDLMERVAAAVGDEPS